MVGETTCLASVTERICGRLCDLCEADSRDFRQIESAFQHLRKELLDSALLKKCLNLRSNLHAVAALQSNVSSFLDLLDACNRAVTFVRSGKWNLRAACDSVLVILHLLQPLYQLCKDTQNSPGEAAAQLSSQLALGFRQCFALQSNSLGLLEELCKEGTETVSRSSVSAVCDRLCCLAALVQCLDPKALLSIWRLVSRLFATSPSGGPSEDLPLLLSTLCSNIDAQIRHTVSLPPGPDFDNSVKLSAFLFKVLLNLLSSLHLSEDAAATVLQFLLRIHEHMLSAHRLADVQQTQLSNRLFFMVDLIVDSVVSADSFSSAVFDTPLETQPAAQVCLLARVLLHFHRIDENPQTGRAWLHGPSSVFRRLFALLPSCAEELRLPRSVFSCGFVRAPDLYTFVQLGVCAGAACLGDSDFPCLEAVLFSVLLSDSCRECRLLAEDCWCFIARFGSAELCRSHASLVASITLAATPTVAHRCRRLLARLWPLLSDRQQTDLLASFPLRSCPAVWRHLPLRRLAAGAREEAEGQIAAEGRRLLREEEEEEVTAAFLGALRGALETPSSWMTAWLVEEREGLLRRLGGIVAMPTSPLQAVSCRLLTVLLSRRICADPDFFQVARRLVDVAAPRACSMALAAAVAQGGGGVAPESVLQRLVGGITSSALAAVTAVGACSLLARSAADDRILDVLSRHAEARERFERVVEMQRPLSAEEVTSLRRAVSQRPGDGGPACKRPRQLPGDGETDQETDAAFEAVESAVLQLEKVFRHQHPPHRHRDRVAGIVHRLSLLISDRPTL